MRPPVLADSRGLHRLSPAATSSSSRRGPIVPRLRAVRAALLQETVPASGRLGLCAFPLLPPGPAAHWCGRTGRSLTAGRQKEKAQRGTADQRVCWRPESSERGAPAGRGGRTPSGGSGEGRPPAPTVRFDSVVGPHSPPVTQRRLSCPRRWAPLSPLFGAPASLIPPPRPALSRTASQCPAGESKRDTFP